MIQLLKAIVVKAENRHEFRGTVLGRTYSSEVFAHGRGNLVLVDVKEELQGRRETKGLYPTLHDHVKGQLDCKTRLLSYGTNLISDISLRMRPTRESSVGHDSSH